ncbi:MAB_1171c family putative transporter [Streptomyces sp. NPDC046985]|uniref:MAB_1171c family putative transporter n=1 Tax=Streptomyces sp. NPDC046985 TaxID=3155377 RepID=UPI0034061724
MSLIVYLAAGLFGLSAVVLLLRPGMALRDPLTLSTCAAIVLGSLVFVCSAPLTLAAVNSLTGVPNFGAPVTYGMLSAYSCSLVILLIHWRGGPRERVRRMVLRSVAAYAALIVAIVVLFALGDARSERLNDLDTYYANTPYLREMILLYLIGHSAATLTMCVLCVKWSREVTGLLRAGIRLILAGSLLDVVGFQLCKYTAVAARWAGHDLDVLSTQVAPPLASLGALLCSAGYALPRLQPAAAARLGVLRDYRRLGPLWSRVRFVSTAPKPPSSLWQLPRARLHWREMSIHDALLGLAPYFDDRVRERALSAARHAGRGGHEARIAAEAAMVADAARRAAAREEPLEAPSGYRLHATEVSGTGGLVELAQAVLRSPAEPAEPAVREGREGREGPEDREGREEGTVSTSHG